MGLKSTAVDLVPGTGWHWGTMGICQRLCLEAFQQMHPNGIWEAFLGVPGGMRPSQVW